MIKIFFILNRKVTPQKNRCVGCWLLALPRAQMTRLSRILGVWFTYYVPVLINFMTPSKHLSIAYQGINLRRLLRFFFLSKAHHMFLKIVTKWREIQKSKLKVIPLFCTAHPLLRITMLHPRWRRFFPLARKERTGAAFAELRLLLAIIMPQIG